MSSNAESVSDSGSKKKSNKARSLYKEFDMQVNNVVTLKATNDFDERDKAVHLEHNRVLQEGFHSGDPAELLSMIQRNYPKGTKPDAWTTDFIQPTLKTALGLNIAADLIVSYQVKVDDYQSQMQQVYNKILEKDPNFESNCQDQIRTKMMESENTIKAKEEELYASFVKNKPTATAEELVTIRKDARALAEFAVGKQITNAVVGEYIAAQMPAIMQEMGVPAKPLHDKSTNNDVAILGAAGSGKSHLLRTNMPDIDKREMITLATDDYRGVHIPGTGAHESKETQQVFTRTQDSAYLVKELVMGRMSQLVNAPQRPNILFDGITYESRFLNPLIEPSKNNFRSVVACLPEARQAPNRAFDRAVNSNDPADKGRFVNTEALIAGHKSIGGAALIDGVPTNAALTRLVNTFTQDGEAPKEFGSITHDQTAHGVVATVRITDVKMACDYFGKQNLNPSASMRQDIYSLRSNANDADTFKYNDYHKARSLLSLVSLGEPGKPWVKQKALEFGEPPYVNIRLARDDHTGKYRFDIQVLNEARYKEALNSGKTPESKANSTLLKEVVMQAKTFNKMEMTVPFNSEESNAKIIKERQILGVKNLEREFIPRMN